jgi:hypothetical protein
MRVFHCSRCGQVVFFDSTSCLTCGATLALLPATLTMAAIVPTADDPTSWEVVHHDDAAPAAPAPARVRRCVHADRIGCNWARIDPVVGGLCEACRLTAVIPSLSDAGHLDKWAAIEAAKRRLVYGLLLLELPVVSRAVAADGVRFELLADPPAGTNAPRVLTGHSGGVITLNIAEADDVERERRRLEMGEPYRTLLGHFRHEIGHYYWDRLVKDTPQLAVVRRAFGDDRQDYADALDRHHAEGPPPDWAETFISAYATAHPWEDWAESWAHYLHLVDALETAACCGLSLGPARAGEPVFDPAPLAGPVVSWSFDAMITQWFSLAYVLNNLTRSMGVADPYPFVLPAPVLEKLRVVHEVVRSARTHTGQ